MVLFISKFSVSISVFKEILCRLMLNRYMNSDVIVSMMGIEIIIIMLVWMFSDIRFIISMMVIVLVMVFKKLFIDFFIVCGMFDIVVSVSLVGRCLCNCLVCLFSVLFRWIMLLFGCMVMLMFSIGWLLVCIFCFCGLL